MSPRSPELRVRALAKVNLTLRVLGLDGDGYHELRTTFQSVALHDTLTFTPVRGRWSIESDDPRCPCDRTNLVWRAAASLWRAAGRRGVPTGMRVRIVKRIPVQAGLGGGSSDAAAALRALTRLWGVTLRPERLHAVARTLGADVPFFLYGGTMLGLARGDFLFRLADWPDSWVVIVVPPEGVRTADAYRWWDEDRRPAQAFTGAAAGIGRVPASELINDLQSPVATRRPDIAEFAGELGRRGAYHAMMSGSGSAVFGLFQKERTARAAASALRGAVPALVTRTVSGRRFAQASRPATG